MFCYLKKKDKPIIKSTMTLLRNCLKRKKDSQEKLKKIAFCKAFTLRILELIPLSDRTLADSERLKPILQSDPIFSSSSYTVSLFSLFF